ncbi:MAG: YqgE/AlgH family protein [Bacteroidetes bacterium]|nr:YqgE/AlgH family protein [Bacteroidota bacterium]
MAIQSDIQIKQGDLLLSEPFMRDTHFKRTVILICEHNELGSAGLILNQSAGMTIADAIDTFPQVESDLFFGGPVETELLFYVHTLGEKIPGSKHIIDNIYWGGDFEQMKFLLDTKQVGKNDIRFFAGYSGWGPGQLKAEHDTNSWIVTPATHSFVFESNYKHLWKSVLRSMGKSFGNIANYPEDPMLN